MLNPSGRERSWSSWWRPCARSGAPIPSWCRARATLAGLSVPERIVTIAESQVGYSTEPSVLRPQQVQRLLGRRHGGLPEWREGRGVVRRLRRLGLAGGWSAVHVRLRPGRDQRWRRQLLRAGGRQRRIAPGDERLRRFAGRPGGVRPLALGQTRRPCTWRSSPTTCPASRARTW